MKRALLSFWLFCIALGAHAQPSVVNYCVTGITSTGALTTAPCTTANPLPVSLSGSSSVTGNVSIVQGGNTAAVNSNGAQLVALTPSSGSSIGITSVVSAAAESSHVLKASAGNLYSVYATNQTATAGFLLLLNATTAPADGAVSPLECIPLPANGNATINYGSGPPSVFSTGIVAVVSSGANCFTKTTGTVTAFLKGSVQ